MKSTCFEQVAPNICSTLTILYNTMDKKYVIICTDI